MQHPDAEKSAYVIGHQQLQGLFFSPIPRDEFFDSSNAPLEDQQLFEKGDFSVTGYGKDWKWTHLAEVYQFDDKGAAEQFSGQIGGVVVRVIHDREEAFLDLHRSSQWYEQQWDDFVHGKT